MNLSSKINMLETKYMKYEDIADIELIAYKSNPSRAQHARYKRAHKRFVDAYVKFSDLYVRAVELGYISASE